MTHLNAFSYGNRLVMNLFSIVCFLGFSNYVFKYNYFGNLMKGKKGWDIKFFCYTLCLIVIIFWIFYDILVSIYNATESAAVKEIADVLLNVVFTSHSSVCFLLIAYFRVLIKDTLDTSNFMSELEFKIYIIYSIIAIPMYIIIQYLIRFTTHNNLLFVAVPQLIYTGEMTICSILFIWLIFRVKARIRTMNDGEMATVSFKILTRVIKLLYILITCNLLIGWSLGIINCYYIPGNIKDLSKYWLDFLTSVFSIGYFFMVMTVLIIVNVGRDNNLTINGHRSRSKTTGTTKSNLAGRTRTNGTNATGENYQIKSVVSMIESNMDLVHGYDRKPRGDMADMMSDDGGVYVGDNRDSFTAVPLDKDVIINASNVNLV